MNKETKTVFETLLEINGSKYVKSKNGFSYLSWSDAVSFLLRAYPEATWTHTTWGDSPVLKTPAGSFVECSVTVEGITRTQLHPVL
ncbi:DUF1071 domain-containing protein, partial [candidate division KSB1 bacterium]|nr:DUF1071 domain-containing protein [candidate division KSB1 bacterium]